MFYQSSPGDSDTGQSLRTTVLNRLFLGMKLNSRDSEFSLLLPLCEKGDEVSAGGQWLTSAQ